MQTLAVCTSRWSFAQRTSVVYISLSSSGQKQTGKGQVPSTHYVQAVLDTLLDERTEDTQNRGAFAEQHEHARVHGVQL